MHFPLIFPSRPSFGQNVQAHVAQTYRSSWNRLTQWHPPRFRGQSSAGVPRPMAIGAVSLSAKSHTTTKAHRPPHTVKSSNRPATTASATICVRLASCNQRRRCGVLAQPMPQPAGATEAPSAVDKARQLLHRRLKVTLKDNRVLLGDLQCLDKQGNLILSNTVEEHVASGSAAGAKPAERVMGTVLVPFQQQADVHMQVMPSERASMLQLVGS